MFLDRKQLMYHQTKKVFKSVTKIQELSSKQYQFDEKPGSIIKTFFPEQISFLHINSVN